MNGWTPYVVAGIAVAAPVILDEGEKAGVLPIPAFVTDAQRAAMRELGNPILGVSQADATDLRALDRVTEVVAQLVTFKGGIGDRTDLANLTGDDVDALLTAVLNACRAGVVADAGYDIVPTLVAPLSQVDMFDSIVNGSITSSADLTPLGAAVREAALVQRASRSDIGSLTQVPGQLAAKDLALEMDSVGYLITGQPFEPTAGGALAAIADALEHFGVNVAGSVGGVVLGGLADVALSAPGLLLVAGYVVWRAVR